jgi:hypothetical protein
MKNLNDPEVKALGTFETSTSIYQTTRRKIIENFHPFFSFYFSKPTLLPFSLPLIFLFLCSLLCLFTFLPLLSALV